MDRITMAFGPISDVTGFSHKGGRTFLEIQELLRRGHNDLVAAFNNLVSHVEGRNTDLQNAFDQALATLTAEVTSAIERIDIPAQQYEALVDGVEALLVQLQPFTTADTNYAAEFTATLNT